MRDSKLEQVAGNSYMFHRYLAVGIYFDDATNSAILIDSGVNEKEAKRIDTLIRRRGCRVSSIIITHGHLSQLGGLHYFKRRYGGLRIYASHWTSQFIENRSLEPLLMGSISRNVQQQSGMGHYNNLVTDVISYQDQELTIDDIALEIVTLPGHFPGMLGVVTPDLVFYVADALFGESTLNKQKLLYYMDIQEAKASMQKITDSNKSAYVLTHGGMYETVTTLIDKHHELIDQTYSFMLEQMNEHPLTLELITQKIMNEFEIKDDMEHYTLTQFIARSYLNQLMNDLKLEPAMQNGVLYYYYYDKYPVAVV